MYRSHVFAAAALALFGLTEPATAEEPIDCTDPRNTYEINVCGDRALKAADDDLNAVYQKALKAIPGLADSGSSQFNAEAWEKALRESQRAWIAFRDAECGPHTAMFWTGGTGTTGAILGCKTDKTKQRTEELKEHYNIE